LTAKEDIYEKDRADNEKSDVHEGAEDTKIPPVEGRLKDKDSLEPMPDVLMSPDAEATMDDAKDLPLRGAHGRQPSLSLQSKMRSSSFRKSSISHGAASPPIVNFKVSALPPLSPDCDSVHEVFRKQAVRLDELERDNRRLEKELEEVNARRKKSEEQLEDLREASVDVVELKDRLQKSEHQAADVERLVGYTHLTLSCNSNSQHSNFADRKLRSLRCSVRDRTSNQSHIAVVSPFQDH
jgi:hypothetical protein